LLLVAAGLARNPPTLPPPTAIRLLL